MKNYYRILGLNIDAEHEEIKAAYRILAQRYHPDKGGAAAEFHLIKEAYDILINPLTKRSYDADLLDHINHPLATKTTTTNLSGCYALSMAILLTSAAIAFAIWAYLKQQHHSTRPAITTQVFPAASVKTKATPAPQPHKLNSKKAPAPTSAAEENPFNALSGNYYVLNVGSYSNKSSAQQQQSKLKSQGYRSSIQKIEANSEGLGGYNVFMGPYSTTDKPLQLQSELESQNINATLEKINFNN